MNTQPMNPISPRDAAGVVTVHVSVDVIARKLGLSRQTLFRNLKAEDVNFEQVLDELRFKTALRHLKSGNTSIARTARLVGFSEPSAFSRAFKLWSGLSPRNYVARGDTRAKPNGRPQ
jgi:AraC-like DNA-binding protein